MDRLYHLTRVEDLSLPIIRKLFKRAKHYETCLQDKIQSGGEVALPDDLREVRVYIVFFEESTRTFSTYDSAAEELGAKVVAIPLATQFSAFAKEEALKHSIQFWSGAGASHLRLADIIVIRHFEADACQRSAEVSGVPIIDAGTGGEEGQHITQGLLDAYAYQEFLGKKDSLRIVFVGDLRFSRILPTELPLLHMIYPDLEVGLVAPQGFEIKPSAKNFLIENGIPFMEFRNIKEAISSKDWEIGYFLRTQKNRLEKMGNQEEADRLWALFLESKDNFAATQEVYDLSKRAGTIFCHPGPIDSKIQEIRPEVEELERTKFLRQWGYGFPIRMAVLTESWHSQKEIDMKS